MKFFYVDEVVFSDCFARKLLVKPYYTAMHPVLEAYRE